MWILKWRDYFSITDADEKWNIWSSFVWKPRSRSFSLSLEGAAGLRELQVSTDPEPLTPFGSKPESTESKLNFLNGIMKLKLLFWGCIKEQTANGSFFCSKGFRPLRNVHLSDVSPSRCHGNEGMKRVSLTASTCHKPPAACRARAFNTVLARAVQRWPLHASPQVGWGCRLCGDSRNFCCHQSPMQVVIYCCFLFSVVLVWLCLLFELLWKAPTNI